VLRNSQELWQTGDMRTTQILSSDRTSKAITGLTVNELKCLEYDFAKNLQTYYVTRRPNRQRKLGGGPRGVIPSQMDKLIAILLYLKAYPTYDVMGVLYGVDRSRCCRWVQEFLPVLEKTLGYKAVLPKRQIHSIEEFIQLFPDVKDVFIDGTERPTQKPKDPSRRKKMYSGKKKATTRKTIVVSDKDKRILSLSVAKNGRRHDNKLADQANIARSLPKDVTAWVDTGFQGMDKDHPNLQIPKKRSKHHPFTEEDKQNNKTISGIRIIAEHAICGMKRMRSTSDIYRNKIPNLDDTFNLVSAGLWNYHLMMRLATTGR